MNNDQNRALDTLSKHSGKEQQALVDLHKKIYTLTEKAKSIFSEITSIKSSQQAVQSRLGKFSSSNTNITHQLARLASIVDIIARDLEILKSSFNTEDIHFEDLQTSNAEIQKRLKTLKAEIDKKGSIHEVIYCYHTRFYALKSQRNNFKLCCFYNILSIMCDFTKL